MKPEQVRAAELLMSHSDSAAAAILGIELETLRKWMKKPQFAQELRVREREQKAASARLARQAVVNAAESLCAAVADKAKCDTKLLLEVLKVAGAFETEPGESHTSLAEILREAERAARPGVSHD